MMNKKSNNVTNTIYDILEEHAIGIDIYDVDTVQEIIDFLDNKNIQYTYVSEDFYNMNGYLAGFTWIDEENPNNPLQLIMFEVQY